MAGGIGGSSGEGARERRAAESSVRGSKGGWGSQDESGRTLSYRSSALSSIVLMSTSACLVSRSSSCESRKVAQDTERVGEAGRGGGSGRMRQFWLVWHRAEGVEWDAQRSCRSDRPSSRRRGRWRPGQPRWASPGRPRPRGRGQSPHQRAREHSCWLLVGVGKDEGWRGAREAEEKVGGRERARGASRGGARRLGAAGSSEVGEGSGSTKAGEGRRLGVLLGPATGRRTWWQRGS